MESQWRKITTVWSRDFPPDSQNSQSCPQITRFVPKSPESHKLERRLASHSLTFAWTKVFKLIEYHFYDKKKINKRLVNLNVESPVSTQFSIISRHFRAVGSFTIGIVHFQLRKNESRNKENKGIKEFNENLGG